ncbi:MAG TPA: NAD(P)H-binding protein [Mycobacteriales bacterium]|nr:NAD(P)H-binding protein [Mycobacteriales bacterium]
MIVITTPTGDIGRQTLNLLLTSGTEKLRVIARDPARLPAAVRDRVDVVAGSHRDPAVVDRAFTGADAVLWVIPPDPQATDVVAAYTGFTRAAADAFATHGVTHVVGVSALGRGTPVAGDAGLVTAALAMDDLIASTGVAYRALANPGFMDNLLRQVDSIRAGSFGFTVAPDRSMPLAATRDIAAVAADLLQDRSWTGTAEVPVLGPENYTPNDLARIMTEALDRPVQYRRQSFEELGAGMTRYGASPAVVRGMVDMMRAKEAGLDDGVERTPQTASPTSFRQWCEEVLKPAVAAG